MSGRLHVEAPDEASALELIDGLRAHHAELVPAHGVRCGVQVDLEDHEGRRLGDALRAVRRWLAVSGLTVVRVRLDDGECGSRPPAA